MNNYKCPHCGGPTTGKEKPCEPCHKELQHLDMDVGGKEKKKFLLFFVAVAIFCGVMMLALPR